MYGLWNLSPRPHLASASYRFGWNTHQTRADDASIPRVSGFATCTGQLPIFKKSVQRRYRVQLWKKFHSPYKNATLPPGRIFVPVLYRFSQNRYNAGTSLGPPAPALFCARSAVLSLPLPPSLPLSHPYAPTKIPVPATPNWYATVGVVAAVAVGRLSSEQHPVAEIAKALTLSPALRRSLALAQHSTRVKPHGSFSTMYVSHPV